LAFARAIGLDPAATLAVVREGSAYSTVMDTKGQKMLEGDFSTQARLAQHLKDVRLILEQAEAGDLKLPFSDLHARILDELTDRGFGDEDNSAIIRAYD
jgi:3-hydroxyisobutyrate dehydrogenase-like beta-hydroxyacid dehydrogenase